MLPTGLLTDISPIRAIRCWPADAPVAAVIAGDPGGRTRYSLLCRPVFVAEHHTWNEAWSRIRVSRRAPGESRPHPFGPGWIVSLPYALGEAFEPAAATTPCIHPPVIRLARVEHGWVHDNRTDRWDAFGGPGGPRPPSAGEHEARLGRACGLERAGRYREAVAHAVELIRAGDVFQVNLAHRLSAPFTGSPRAVFARLATRLAPWHGCYLETPSAAVASASPELFLSIDPAGGVTTRPMKGTRAGDDRSLDLSEKDRAELAMIVDLMRNDLGRVCGFGSVRVSEARAIEPHGQGDGASPLLWQGVATVEGRLRRGTDLDRVLRAAFPPGSITGAPKVRAMQIIDEFEPALGFDDTLPKRGPYCGACGFVGDDGSAQLSVAIRTAVFTDGRCHYPVGAGIVADSDPVGEWQETLIKARPFLDLCEDSAR